MAVAAGCPVVGDVDAQYPGLLAVHDEVHSWITRSDHVATGPPREVWLTASDDTDGLRVRVTWPYAPRIASLPDA